MAANEFDLIIVGSGPAGITAAIYGQRLGMSVVLFGDTPGGNSYMIEHLENYPGFMGGVPGAQWGVSAFAQAQAEGTMCPMSKVDRLYRDDDGRLFVAVDSHGEEYRAQTAVLACGLVPNTEGIPPIDKKGVYFCSLCDGPLFRGKNATLAVIGGGNMAGQQCLTLAKVASRVVMVYRGARLSMEAVMRQAIEKSDNIEILLGTTVQGYRGGGAELDGLLVTTAGGEKKEIDADGVFVAIGWNPKLGMMEINVDTTEEGYLKTDGKLMTSFPGLFAAGDIRDTDMRQVVTACADGARAATYALEYIEGVRE